MASKIVTIIGAMAILLSASAAWAGTTCYRVGNYTYCDDDYGRTTTCYRVGNYTYCD